MYFAKQTQVSVQARKLVLYYVMRFVCRACRQETAADRVLKNLTVISNLGMVLYVYKKSG